MKTENFNFQRARICFVTVPVPVIIDNIIKNKRFIQYELLQSIVQYRYVRHKKTIWKNTNYA